MIYRNKLRMIYKAYALIYLEKRDIVPTNKLHLEEDQDGFG